MKALRIFLVMALGVVFAMGVMACSLKPSENLSKQRIIKSVQGEWPGMTKFLSFQKTNGQEITKNEYHISYKARFEIIKDMKGYSPKGMGFHITALKGFRWIKVSGNPKSVNVKKGDIFETSGTDAFVKTEKGWASAY